MFIDESNIYGINKIHIEADTSYDGAIGCQVALVEAYQNDFEFLKAAVLADVRETAMIRESASDEDITSMREGMISSVWNKLKELVKKIIAKVKGIFHAFIARMEAFMNKNGHAFYTKYKKVLYDGTDISKLKFKWCPPKEEITADKILRRSNVDLDSIVAKIKSDVSDFSFEDYVGSSEKDFKKDFREQFFDSEETEEADSGKMGVYCKYISDKKSVIDEMKKVADKEESNMNRWVSDIDKAASNMSSNIANGKTDNVKINNYGGKDAQNPRHQWINKQYVYVGDPGTKEKTFASTESGQKELLKYQKAVSIANKNVNLVNSAALDTAKFAVSQSRRIAAIIVAYKSRHGSKHESADLNLYLNTVGEAAEYEALSELEAL